MSCKAHVDIIKKRLTLAITGEGHPAHTYIPQLRNTGCNKTRQNGALIGHILYWFIEHDTMNENEYNTYVKGNYDTPFNGGGRGGGLKGSLRRRFATSVTPWLGSIQQELESDIAVFENTTATIRITKVWKTNINDVAFKLFGNFSWRTSQPQPQQQPQQQQPRKPWKLSRVGDVSVRYKACYAAAVEKVRGLDHCELTEAGIALLYARLAKRCKREPQIATYHMPSQRKIFAIITSRINNVAKYRGQFGLEAVNDADIETVLMI